MTTLEFDSFEALDAYFKHEHENDSYDMMRSNKCVLKLNFEHCKDVDYAAEKLHKLFTKDFTRFSENGMYMDRNLKTITIKFTKYNDSLLITKFINEEDCGLELAAIQNY